MRTPLRHGAFVAPFHDVRESPTLLLRRDIELASILEDLGYDEFWYGEHHSLGWEIISSPELMIAGAAERTKRIRLGTGVASLSYHNPLMVANRIMQLDHQTMGRVMLGVGPGMLATDANMLGIDTLKQRDMMAESFDAIFQLLQGKAVTAKTDWFELNDARTHLLPYSKGGIECAVASAVTPSGGMVAGKYGVGMLCVAATNPGGYGSLGTNWGIAKQVAADYGITMNPSGLRLVGPMHIAETRDQARKNVEHGLIKWCNYMDLVRPPQSNPMVKPGKDMVDSMIETGFAVIGTPDDAIAQIHRLYEQQGEFGAFLHLAHDWANWEATIKSYDLYARYVMPHFAKTNGNRDYFMEVLERDHRALMAQRYSASDLAFKKWEDRKKPQ